MSSDINKQHAVIAREIRLAKKRMFARHRQGMSLSEAYQQFEQEVSDTVEGTDHFEHAARQTGDASSFSSLPEPPIKDIHQDWVRLSEAINVIVTSDATPTKLYKSTIDFLSSNSGDLWGRLMVQPNMIVKILVAAAIKEEEKEESAGGAQ